MKGKSLAIWVLVLAAAAGAWLLSGSWQEKKEKAQAQEGRLLSLGDPLSVQTLEISGREMAKPIRIERQDQEHRWLIKEPLVWPADGGVVGRVLDGLLQAKIKDRHQAPGRLADFGLEPPAFKVVLSDRTGAKAEILLGELSPGKDHLYAVQPGSSEVFFLSPDLRGLVGRPLFELREKRMLDFAAPQVRGLDLRLGQRRIILERQGKDEPAVWELKGKGPAEPRAADRLIFQARGMMATSFQDEGVNLERMGLVQPWGEVRLTLEGGVQVALLVGGPVPGGKPGQEERYVRRLEGGPVMTVKRESLDRLAPDPKEVMERRLLRLEREQIVGLAIQRDGKELRYEKKDAGFARTAPPGGGTQAGETAELFLFDLLNLRWDEKAPAAKPLDQPGAVITVTLAAPAGQAQTATLTLGPLKGQGPLEARVAGDEQAYLTPRDFADKLPAPDPEGGAADK